MRHQLVVDFDKQIFDKGAISISICRFLRLILESFVRITCHYVSIMSFQRGLSAGVKPQDVGSMHV